MLLHQQRSSEVTEITMTAEQARTATKDAAIMIIRHAVDAAIKKGENEA